LTRNSKNPLNSAEKLVAANPMKTTVREYFGPFRSETDGRRIGIEVEVETANDHYPNAGRVNDTSKYWLATIDGSLRNAKGTGAGGQEYIIKNSIPFGEAEPALKELETLLKGARSKVRKSNRTSVHVHVNVQDMTLTELMTFFCLYYTVEPILCRYNGFERENNLFALQAITSETILANLSYFLRNRRFSNKTKYSALNFMTLGTGSLGTVEFRAGAGIEKSPMEVLPWIALIESLFDSLGAFKKPEDVLYAISERGPLRFLQKYVPYIFEVGTKVFELDELDHLIMQSTRNAQGLAYEIDWGDYKPTKKKAGSKTSLTPVYGARANAAPPPQPRPRTVAAPHLGVAAELAEFDWD